jgi:hypothetical protein
MMTMSPCRRVGTRTFDVEKEGFAVDWPLDEPRSGDGVGAGTMFYDNYIVGGADQRDFFEFNSGILIGAEVGIADRFGHYQICCDTVVYSNGVTHSVELWGRRHPSTRRFCVPLRRLSHTGWHEGRQQRYRNTSTLLTKTRE